ncbi:hypothetical protein ACQ4PT_009219 [Festuca glaucescens]
MENEFSKYLGSSWRCTARPINSTQFIMRFPNPKEVERDVFFGKRMEMKTCDAVLNLSPWTAAVGASGILNKAWVCVRNTNIPSKKRCDAHTAYARSLVGITLEVDQATLHKPEYCRILLGCRDINNLPETVEGTLGDFFYIVSYEVETIVAQGPPVVHNSVLVNNSFVSSSPKRPRTKNYSATSAEGYTGDASQLVGTGFGRTHTQILATVSEHESKDDSEVETKLLIDVIAREDDASRNTVESGDISVEANDVIKTDSGSFAEDVVKSVVKTVTIQASITPVVEKEVVSHVMVRANKQLVVSYAATVAGPSWSVALVITEVIYGDGTVGEEQAEYYVQLPPSTEKSDELPVEKLVPPEELRKDNLRNPEELL